MTRTPSSQPLARTPLAAAILGVTLALPLGLIAPLLGHDGQAHAETRMQTYSIPAGALGSALARFANEAGVVLSFDAALTNGRQSPGLQGRYSVEQGFSRLLAGTGLQALAGQGGNFSLVPAVEAGEALELSSVAISGKVQGATTEGTGSYTTGAVSIGKSVQSLRETPQSVTVMTRQVMDDKNLNTLDQVLSKTPGLSFTQRNFGSHRYQSRGFDIDDEAYMMDGIPGQAYNMTGWMPTDMAIYDRVEVLRGAAGLLVGAGGPGGAINLVRKRPTAEPQFSITTRAGSWDNYRLDLDGSSRLNDAGTLRGRFVAAYEDKGSYLDGLDAKTPLLYGIVEADLTDDTTLTLSVRRQRTEIRGYTIFNLPRYSNGQSLDISRSTSLTQDWNKHETELDEVFTELAHRLNDDWTLKTSLTHSEGGFDQALAYARGAVNPVTQAGSTFRSVEFRNTSANSSGIDSFLEGRFDAFGRSHQVTVGANWSKQEITEKRAPVSINVPIDIFDVDRHAFAKPARPAWSVISDYVDTRAGVYANTRLRLSEPLSLVLGARVSWYKYDFDNRFGSGDYVARQHRQVTPFAGLIYDIDQNWSWYASYADIFKPQSNQRNVGGSFLDPAVGTNYETGIKGELLDKRLNLSLALFYIKREDVSVEDKANSGQCLSNDTWGTCYINGGIQRSKGFDVEASGEVLPGLEVLAGYTYNMTSSAGNAAMTIDTPKHLARVSTSYTLPGNWSRLTLGAGVSAQSGYVNETTLGDEYGSPGRAILDARASWKLDEHWKVSLTGENLTDRKYYATAVGTDRGNIFGDPRSYMLTLRGDF
ncbi:TonB-dependent siderophore receptor [Pseudomonas sp. ABC1]|uniref:TonB-dependent siderophore receptor n=1 Tax=Pseudomonas sp. ABC1 TaxID=2748080 RepID=UPI0015C37BD5|nr:TonB-dependent receptor [Pseudomonas sp. ABC1]QLF93495.1 TonB-dependent siderophore receptor [Pseudomonas sp. ABC1]